LMPTGLQFARSRSFATNSSNPMGVKKNTMPWRRYHGFSGPYPACCCNFLTHLDTRQHTSVTGFCTL
jgi:hypothetical protein